MRPAGSLYLKDNSRLVYGIDNNLPGKSPPGSKTAMSLPSQNRTTSNRWYGGVNKTK